MSHNGPSWGRRYAEVNGHRARVEQAIEKRDQAQREVDRYTVVEWNVRMSLLRGPAQPSPTIGAAINGGYPYLRVNCSGCHTDAWLDLRQVRRPPETQVWKLEGALACDRCRRGGQRAPRAVIQELTSAKGRIREPPE